MNDSLATDNRAKMRRRREKRKDAVIELPFGKPVEVTCPECGETFETGIYADPEDYSPTFDNCPNWDCDAFLKFASDGSEEKATVESSEPTQADLGHFSGGVSS